MKVQTRGLLADLSTMKPPGPFSPLRREIHRGGLLNKARPRPPHHHSWPSWTVVTRGSLGTTSLPQSSPEPVPGAAGPAFYPHLPIYPSLLVLTLAPQWQGIHHQPALICSIQISPVSCKWGKWPRLVLSSIMASRRGCLFRRHSRPTGLCSPPMAFLLSTLKPQIKR